MNDDKIRKFENPIRIAELDPTQTLLRAGLSENMVLCDIGAGTGVFVFPAAEITNNTVYALEIEAAMIDLLENRKKERGIKNLEIRKVDSLVLPLEHDSCDIVIMVTSLHEIEDKDSLFNEIDRILTKNGKLLIIEFHKRITPMGAPLEYRIAESYVEELCEKKGFEVIEKISLGDNFYSVSAKHI